MRVAIVASGPSARGFVPPDDITVIAVNGAIDWIQRADYAFTLDPSKVNMARQLKRYDVRYVIALPAGYRRVDPNIIRYRRIAYRGEEPTDKSSAAWLLWRFAAVKGLSTEPGCIHTGNSSWGALGLAYHLGATSVALVGVDGNSEPKVDGGSSGNLAHLGELFASAIGQIDVVSCGALNTIPQISFEDWYC